MSRSDRVVSWVLFIETGASGCLLSINGGEWQQFAPICWFFAALTAGEILWDYYGRPRKPPSH